MLEETNGVNNPTDPCGSTVQWFLCHVTVCKFLKFVGRKLILYFYCPSELIKSVNIPLDRSHTVVLFVIDWTGISEIRQEIGPELFGPISCRISLRDWARAGFPKDGQVLDLEEVKSGTTIINKITMLKKPKLSVHSNTLQQCLIGSTTTMHRIRSNCDKWIKILLPNVTTCCSRDAVVDDSIVWKSIELTRNSNLNG